MQPLAYLLNVNAPHESPRWEQVGEDHKLGDNVVPVVPFSDYEALQKELGYSKMAADAEAEFANEYKAKFEALKAENEAQEKRINEQDLLIKILMSAAGLLGSAEQAKKIADLEEHVTKLGAGSRQHLYKAFARRYREILSLRRENEALRKQSDEMLAAMRRAVLALAFAAESSKAMQDDYQALSNAIDRAVESKNGDSK